MSHATHRPITSQRRSTCLLAAAACLFAFMCELAAGEPPMAPLPKLLDPRLKIELFAQEPQIVTPVGIVVDSRGRPVVIESHTHFRSANYQGPPADRIRRFEDTDGDGRADRIETIYEGSTATMGLALEPSGSLLVVTRGELFRLSDVDGDDKDHKKTTLARLDTKERYPHNGLGGVALDALGNIYLSMGENLGNPYRIVGSDNRALSGEGDGGGIYRLRPDGSGLERWSTGFWNPFHLTFDPFGRLFAVDNDPDSRPPCRLLHIVEGGDYGYRMRNGRKGLHPFTSWFGQSPGTLGIVAGTGEAPSGVLVYESDNLPDEYRGDLLVTSWGDHQIERYRPQPRGATFQSVSQPVVVGNEHFRPVGIASAPDGSIFITDWVDASYSLHGKGRIWHLKAAKQNDAKRPPVPKVALMSADRRWREAAAQKLIASGTPGIAFLDEHVRRSPDPQVRAAAYAALGAAGNLDGATRTAALRDSDPRIQALAITLSPREAIDPVALADAAPSAEVRAAAVRHLDSAADRDAALRWLASDDPWIRQAARAALSRSQNIDQLLQIGLPKDATQRMEIALLLRASGDPRATALVPRLLTDDDRRIRLLAVQWVGESRLVQFREQVLARLKLGDDSGGMLSMIMATLDLLERGGKPSAFEGHEDQAVSRLLGIADLPPPVLARVLRYLPPDHKSLSTPRLTALLADPAIEVRTEAIRTLRDSGRQQRLATLTRLAADDQQPASLRAEAIAGLTAGDAASRQILLSLAASPQAEVRDEALRSLRGATLMSDEKQSLTQVAQQQPVSRDLVARLVEDGWKPTGRPDAQQPAQWVDRFAGGNPDAGERVFFHPQGPRCGVCHRVNGRGGKIGPELSGVGEMGPRRILESILTPSREIAPQFVNWSFSLRDGRTVTGLLVTEAGDGKRVYADSTGALHSIHRDQIEETRPLAASVMPDGLADLMTDQELRDVVAFLLKCR